MQQDSPRNLVLRLLRAQVLLAVVAFIVAAFGFGLEAAAGVTIGTGIGVLLNLILALRTFVQPADALPQQMVAALYRAAAMKLVVAVILFVLVARWIPHLFVPVMIGYMITLAAHWIVGLRMVQNVSQADEGQ